MKVSTILLISVAMFAHPAMATMVYEGFSGYTVDASVVGQGPATTGFTGVWSNTGGILAATVDIQPRTAGLSYANYAPGSDGLLEGFRSSGTHSGASKSVSRSFSGYTVSDTSDLYIAFLLQSNSTAADDLSEVRLVAQASVSNDRDARLTLDHGTGALAFTPGGGSALTYTETAVSGTNLLVIRAMTDNSVGNPNSAFYDAIQVWINPSINATDTPTAADLGAPDFEGWGIMRDFSGSTALPYNRLRVQHSLDSGNLRVDELVITHDLSDIVAIPEANTLALLGVALISLRLLRRRG